MFYTIQCRIDLRTAATDSLMIWSHRVTPQLVHASFLIKFDWFGALNFFRQLPLDGVYYRIGWRYWPHATLFEYLPTNSAAVSETDIMEYGKISSPPLVIWSDSATSPHLPQLPLISLLPGAEPEDEDLEAHVEEPMPQPSSKGRPSIAGTGGATGACHLCAWSWKQKKNQFDLVYTYTYTI